MGNQRPEMFARKEPVMTTRQRALPTFALIAIATAAVALGSAASAHAQTYDYFQSPSGNIACEMIKSVDGTGFVACKLKNHTWAAPSASGGDCEFAGPDLKLSQGDAACAGVWLRSF
jgi:hypothetical protein